MARTKTRKMTEGKPMMTILLFALPMIGSNLFMQMYHLVDTLIVGRNLGTDALAAVGSAGSITALFVQLSCIFFTGNRNNLSGNYYLSNIFCHISSSLIFFRDSQMSVGKLRCYTPFWCAV